jgi:hypothetical protein
MENLSIYQIMKRIAQKEARYYEKMFRQSVKDEALELLCNFEELLESKHKTPKQQKVILITIYEGLSDDSLEHLMEVNQY